MFLELHHVEDYIIFPHSIIINYLTFIKVAWHKNQRKFDFCISIKSKIILYIRVQYKFKNHTIRPSIVFNRKSYCTSKCSIKSKIILYVRVQYKFKNHTIHSSIVFNQKSYCASECSINSKITLYVRVYYSIKNRIVRPSIV